MEEREREREREREEEGERERENEREGKGFILFQDSDSHKDVKFYVMKTIEKKIYRNISDNCDDIDDFYKNLFFSNSF